MVEDDTDLLITYFEWMALMQKGDGNDGEPDVLKKLEMDCIRMLSEVSQTIHNFLIPTNFFPIPLFRVRQVPHHYHTPFLMTENFKIERNY